MKEKCDERKRILITSAGGLVGTYLIKHLSKKENYELIGTDVSEMVSQKNSLSVFYRTLATNAPGYLDEISQIVKLERINIIIPVSSYDMNVYTKEEVKNKISPAKMLVMDERMHNMLHDKREAGDYLNRIGIKTPAIVNENELMKFPCIIKANKSSGSRNVVVLENVEDYVYWKNKIENYSIFEYISGDEYTVDCLFDSEGKCVGYNSRKRKKTVGGGAVISTCVMEEKLKETIKKLENCGEIKGPVNFQYKLVDDEICIFDFNTRLASGGLPLTVEAGFDIPEMLIDIILGNPVIPWKPTKENERLTMIRYYDEVYIRD